MNWIILQAVDKKRKEKKENHWDLEPMSKSFQKPDREMPGHVERLSSIEHWSGL